MIPTGLSKLDDFLLGGIPSGLLVDIFGGAGVGKTQLILQICINAVSKNHTVLYVDTTGDFRPERLLELQKQQNNSLNILEKIIIQRITNSAEQIQTINQIRNSNYSLIIIDNITELFSYEYQKEELLLEKNSLFMKYMHDLSLIAINKNIHIVIANTIRTINDQSVENMSRAIDPYTHIKIKLSKMGTNYQGFANWINNHLRFTYKINTVGLQE